MSVVREAEGQQLGAGFEHFRSQSQILHETKIFVSKKTHFVSKEGACGPRTGFNKKKNYKNYSFLLKKKRICPNKKKRLRRTHCPKEQNTKKNIL